MDVLLIEDDDGVRATLKDALEEEGLVVRDAATAEDGLRCLPFHSLPSVIVCDIDLGAGISGLILAEMVKEQWPGIGIVLISGRPWLIKSHVMQSWERFIPKPFPIAQLLRAIEELRQPQSPFIL